MGTMSRERRIAYIAKENARRARIQAVLALDACKTPPHKIVETLGLTRGQVAGILNRWQERKWWVIEREQKRRPGRKRKAVLPLAKMEIGPRIEMEVAISRAIVPVQVELDRVTVADLTPTMCRFPIGDPRAWRTSDEDDFHFCGKDVWGLGPYCEHHLKLCLERNVGG